MALRSVAKFQFGCDRVRAIPLNDDKTIPSPTRIIGGVGPFDFSTAAVPTAVVLKWKIDNGTEQTDTVDITTASDIYNVTVDELVTAITTAAPTGLTASKESVTNRIKLVMTTPGVTVWFQVYSELAEIVSFGQGLGVKFIKSSTIKTLQLTKTLKEDQTFTTTPADGVDIDVIIEGYQKGFTGVVTDAAEDFEMMELMEGGTIDATTGAYEDPNVNTVARYFYLEAYGRTYGEGTNKEDDLTGKQQIILRTCKASMGDETLQAGFRDKIYNITGTDYVDENDVRYSSIQRKNLTIEAYDALHIDTV